MYRDLRAGVEDGRDVRQLERNLSALGYDPGHIDASWTAATTAAVRAWEGDRGDRVDGVVERGEVVVRDGPVRVGEHVAGVGAQVRPGAPVLRLTRRRPVVTARLDAARQADVRRGDAVEVTLPDGSSVPGRVTRVGRVARAGAEGEGATVALQVALRGRRAGRAALDGAPVTVGVAVVRTRGALAVPVTALVATAPGRYAVEVSAPGGRRLVGVRLGAFADGWVQVEGRGLRAGTRVVVPR
jgi:peptidoglycan hydrolase-like protein with peptidoglycan-binding domain